MPLMVEAANTLRAEASCGSVRRGAGLRCLERRRRAQSTVDVWPVRLAHHLVRPVSLDRLHGGAPDRGAGPTSALEVESGSTLRRLAERICTDVKVQHRYHGTRRPAPWTACYPKLGTRPHRGP